MKTIIKRKIIYGALLVICAALCGCTTIVEKSGEALEGGAFAEKTAALYRSEGRRSSRRVELRKIQTKNGEAFIRIEDSSVPGLVLKGASPKADGGFELLEARLLSSHPDGWNEVTLSLIGSASLRVSGARSVLSFAGPAERVQVSSGKIRLKSSRISGDEALRNLRNRRERILAVVDWMREKNPPPELNEREAFEDYWKRLLFPELVSKKKRPPEYSAENAEWIIGGGVKWNKTYTQALLPGRLWDLRDSGALLRDWEEASSWIFLEYNWDSINAAFDGTVLEKIRGD